MKKVISIFLAVLMLMTMFPMTTFAANNSGKKANGTCGKNVSWTLYNDGELVISGTGKMTDYQPFCAPFVTYSASIKKITINNGVTSIGEFAFASCDKLTSITIPDSVTLICDDAFYYCEALTNIKIPDNVTYIGYAAFFNCISLTDITIPDSITSIGPTAFYNCNNLKSITIPAGVSSIGFNAFCHCDSLTSITVDNNNAYYSSDNYGALFNKDKSEFFQYPIGNSRTEYTIPESVTVINNFAFEFSKNLTNITIPEGITSINNYVFYDCSSLKNITIPESVQTIGKYAFGYENDENQSSEVLIDGFTIIGNPGSAAEEYAIENEISFALKCEHPETEIIPEKAATCSETGLTAGEKCSECGAVTKKQNEIPTIAHTFNDWAITSEATFLKEGTMTRECSVCNEKETTPTEKLKADAEVTDENLNIIIKYLNGTYNGEMKIDAKEESDGKAFEILTNEKGESKYVLYDITTIVNGEKVQPEGLVLVGIPLPEGFSPDKTGVYFVSEKNSELLKLNSVYENGYIWFETDHFSPYALIEDTIPGDVNGDGKVNAADARLALRISAKLETPTDVQKKSADVNGDGKITASDARIILRVSAKLETL